MSWLIYLRFSMSWFFGLGILMSWFFGLGISISYKKSNDQDGGRDYLWSSIENTNEKIFKEKIEKQQKILLNLISENFDITMTKIKKVQSYINELKASLEHTETVLEEKLLKQRRK